MVLTDDERKKRRKEEEEKKKRGDQRKCKVSGCTRMYYSKGMCKHHYAKSRNQLPDVKRGITEAQRRHNSTKKRIESQRRWRKNNREKILEKERRRRRENPEKEKEKQRRYREKNPEKIRASKRKYRATEKGRESNRNYTAKWREKNPERWKEIARKTYHKDIESSREKQRKWRSENLEHYRELGRESYRKMSQNPAWLKERNKDNRRLYHENLEKERARGKMYREKNPEKTRIRHKKYTESESGREATRKWRANNRESISAYAKKSRKKNPRADTEIMKIYRRSHRECEWSGCDRSSGHVHHILPKFKYPEYLDGDYHGRVGNNFICYCVFHHHAYHYARATIRNEKRHKKLLSFLWKMVSDWAEENKIPIDALEIELELMFVHFKK
jgi:hypothetical protein